MVLFTCTQICQGGEMKEVKGCIYGCLVFIWLTAALCVGGLLTGAVLGSFLPDGQAQVGVVIVWWGLIWPALVIAGVIGIRRVWRKMQES